MITYHGKTEFYTSLGDRPPANSYGAGNCFVGGTEYVSDGVTWAVGDQVDVGAAALLTGFSASAGTVAATDSILVGFNKVVANIALKATNLLTGLVTTAGTVAAADTVVVGVGKLVGNVALKADILTPVFLSSAVPSTVLVAGTLDSLTMLSGIIVTNATTDENTALTLPTAAVLEAALAIATNNKWFEWTIINLGATTRTITLTAAATTHDIVGVALVAISTSARFRTVRVSSISYITYRVA